MAESGVGNRFWYCCVSKGGRVLYSYNSCGDPEIENLAALCLEMTPPYHQWYLETRARKTFGFLMDTDGYVYFTILSESVGNWRVLGFLEKLRREFGRKLGKHRGSSSSSSTTRGNVVLCLQEQLLPVVRNLVASLEDQFFPLGHEDSTAATTTSEEWLSPSPPPPPPPTNDPNDAGGASSTKAPLLGKSSRQEKRKMKDHHVIAAVEMEEGRRSTERGAQLDSNNHHHLQGTSDSPFRRDYSSSPRNCSSKPSSQNSLHKKWCRQVRIVLAIDAAVCLLLFAIWLIVCHGIDCIR